MKGIKISVNKNVLEVSTTSNEENVFYLIRTFLSKNKDVEVCGVYKEHHLIDDTKFLVKTKAKDPKKFFKDELLKIKKEIEKLKIK